jgi:hypothetical protein
MVAPWTTSIKDVAVSGQTQHWNRHVPVSAGFAPPSLPTLLSFGPAALFGAMAKMQALKSASPALTTALVACFTALTEAVVDDSASEFDLVADLEQLELTMRNALTGAVGAGVCHLYMSTLGYVWNAHATSIIKPARGVGLADFVYDGGAVAGRGIVLAEAKGTFSSTTSAVDVQTNADVGYNNQVNPHIGMASPSSGKVVHGYAIAFGAVPASARIGNPPNAFLHVAETDVSQPSSAGGGGSSAASTAVALGNYRATFILARAPVVVAAIDWILGGYPDPRIFEATQLFRRVHAGGTDFLIGDLEGREVWPYGGLGELAGRSMAIEASVAERVLNALSAIIRGEGRSQQLELPQASLRLLPESAESPVVFADGFAVLPRRVAGGDSMRWSPLRGWT